MKVSAIGVLETVVLGIMVMTKCFLCFPQDIKLHIMQTLLETEQFYVYSLETLVNVSFLKQFSCFLFELCSCVCVSGFVVVRAITMYNPASTELVYFSCCLV